MLCGPIPLRGRQHTDVCYCAGLRPAGRHLTAQLIRCDSEPRAKTSFRTKAKAHKQPPAWRVFDVKVAVTDDPGKDDYSVGDSLAAAVSKKLGCKGRIPPKDLTIVRKSFDARRQLQWVYVVDVRSDTALSAGVRNPHRHPHLKQRPEDAAAPSALAAGEGFGAFSSTNSSGSSGSASPIGSSSAAGAAKSPPGQDPVVIVGSGPAGLFAALTLAEEGLPVVLFERGQPVERRGRDIGALFARQQLNPDSNLCYGEGGAGTWSDGKLVTRIGRNDTPVRQVLSTLRHFGAPASILVNGKPHLGTDRLIGILRAFRARLLALGVQLRWGATVCDIDVQGGTAVGVSLQDGSYQRASRVVLASGHSSRALFERLLASGVTISPKHFALGFRIEHPQELVNEMQYGKQHAAEVLRGKGLIPVADYRLAATVSQDLPAERSTFSFCMCPGGQVVPTSIAEEELCVNGMSFSRRQSKWANAAMVVGTTEADWAHLQPQHGPLAGIALQQSAERTAAQMGGGKMVCPVQRVTDFMAGVDSVGPLPSSSYRLGVRAAPLHELYSADITSALRQALARFDRQLPGFVTEAALLHGVETRTSCPVQIDRDANYQSVSTPGLYPTGEGAGYAGGIVSAAVDGLSVGRAVAADLKRVVRT